MVALGVVAMHLRQVDMLSGSIGEYLKRTDGHARSSKLLFALSLLSCTAILLWPIIGIFCAVGLLTASLGLSMNEWKG